MTKNIDFKRKRKKIYSNETFLCEESTSPNSSSQGRILGKPALCQTLTIEVMLEVLLMTSFIAIII